MQSIEERFWSHVDKNGPIPEHAPELGPCWNWTSWGSKAGYGQISNGRTKKLYVHRFVLELSGVEIPKGKYVCHKCDNRRCCNPSHLFIGSPKQNHQDMMDKGRAKWFRKFTDEQITEVRLRFARGERIQDLAAEFDVHVEVLRPPIMGKTWKHLPLPDELVEFIKRRKTHCVRDHERAVHGYKKNNGWECRACQVIRSQEQRAKQRRRR